MRLRSTALPTFLLTVKPNLAPSTGALPLSSPRRLASRTNSDVAKRAPLRIRKNSGRRLRVAIRAVGGRGIWTCAVAMHPSVAGLKPTGACGPLHAGAPAPCGRQPFPCACGSHGAACERPCSADKYASRLVSVFKLGPEPLENTAARRWKPARGGPPMILPELSALIGLLRPQVNQRRCLKEKRSILLASSHVYLTAAAKLLA